MSVRSSTIMTDNRLEDLCIEIAQQREEIKRLKLGLEDISDGNNKTCSACHENEILANGLLRELVVNGE